MGALDDILGRKNPVQRALEQGQQQTQQIQDAVAGELKRREAARQANQVVDAGGNVVTPDELAKSARHQQNVADPMNNIGGMAGRPGQAGQSGVAGQTGQVAVPQVKDVAGIEAALREVNEARDTPEKKAARERAAKRDRVLGAIGDGLSAFHEAYSHMRGVQPMTSGTSLSGKARLRKERMDWRQREEYGAALDNYLKILKAQQSQERAKQLEKYQQGQMDKWKAEEDDRKERNRLNEYKFETERKYKEGLLDIKKEETEIKRQVAEGRMSHWQAQERLAELRHYASQQPTTSHTVRTDKEGNYAGESTTVRTKGSTGGGKSGGTRKSPTGGGNSKKPKKKSPTAK